VERNATPTVSPTKRKPIPFVPNRNHDIIAPINLSALQISN